MICRLAIGVIHVSNSSQISDESAAPSDKARELVLTAIARVHTAVLTANDPLSCRSPCPLDGSGARLLTTLAYHMRNNGIHFRA